MERITNAFFLVIITLLLLLQFQACTKKEKLKIKVESINFIEKQGELYIDEQRQLIVNILPKGALPINLKWESNKKNVARVDMLGEITAISEGTAIITVRSDQTDKTDKFNLTVKKKIIKVNSIKIIKSKELIASEDTIIENQDAILTVKILPINSKNKTFTWSTSDKNIATIDQDGNLHAIKEGKFIIKAITEDGGKTAEYKLNVKAKRIAIREIKISSESKQVTEGKELRLTGTVIPNNADDKTFTWSVDNKEIATIDQTGKLTAIKEGIVNIKAISAKDGISSGYKITVTKKILVSEIEISSPKERICEGESIKLAAIIKPEDANNKDFTWSVNKEEIATIDQHGNLLAKAVGTVEVIAEAIDKGGISSKYNIEIYAKTIAVTAVMINPIIEELYIGRKISVSATLSPSKPTNPKIFWYTSDIKTAVFDEEGKLNGLKAGKVKIKSVTEDGEKYDEYEIEVKVKLVTDINISTTPKENINEIFVNEVLLFSTSIKPTDATYNEVIWTIENIEPASSPQDAIAIIDQEGHLTAKGKGTINVVATSKDANKVSKYEVQIKDKLVSKIIISTNPIGTKEIFVKDVLSFSALIEPNYATNKEITWTIKNVNPTGGEIDIIATIDDEGNLTAKRKGTVKVIATNSYSKVFGEYEIEIKNVAVEKVVINIPDLVNPIYIEDEINLTATISPENATNKEVSWIITNKNPAPGDQELIAIINNGILTAKKAGTIIITAKSANDIISNECEITIEEPGIRVTGVSIVKNYDKGKDAYEINPSKSKNIIATIYPENSTNKKIIWTSSDKNIATVNEWGNVSAIKDGSVTITATISGYSATCKITVITPVESINFSEATYKITEGESKKIDPIFTPTNATNKEINLWYSDNEDIASVNKDGLVTAHKAGTTIISATIYGEEEDYTAEFNLTVSADDVFKPVICVGYNIENTFITIDNHRNLGAAFSPVDATNQKIIYISNNHDIATVDENGDINAIKEGKVIISATPDATRKKVDIEFIITKFEFSDWLLFKRLLNQTEVDENKDSILSSEELDKTNELKLKCFGIKSFKELEIFNNLEILDCSNNELTSLDLSKCSKLTQLDCRQEATEDSKATSIGTIYLHPDVYDLVKDNVNFKKNAEDTWAKKTL
jgi:uncharacterized protein YjdB